MRLWIMTSAVLLCLAGQVYGGENGSDTASQGKSLSVTAKGYPAGQTDISDFIASYTTGSKAIANNGAVICTMQDSQTPPVGNAICFNPTTGVYTINTPGYYNITYGVTPKTGRARFGLFKNGALVSGATVGCLDATGAHMITGNTILWLTRNTQLKFVNITGASVVIEGGASAADPCAFMNIVKIRSQR